MPWEATQTWWDGPRKARIEPFTSADAVDLVLASPSVLEALFWVWVGLPFWREDPDLQTLVGYRISELAPESVKLMMGVMRAELGGGGGASGVVHGHGFVLTQIKRWMRGVTVQNIPMDFRFRKRSRFISNMRRVLARMNAMESPEEKSREVIELMMWVVHTLQHLRDHPNYPPTIWDKVFHLRDTTESNRRVYGAMIQLMLDYMEVIGARKIPLSESN